MSFNPNIPLATDRPSDSQGDLLNNFGQINTQWAVNHTALTALSVNGYHTKIQFPTGISDPNLASPITSLYTKLVGSAYQLFFQNGNASGNVIPITSPAITTTANAGTAGGNINAMDLLGFRVYFGITAVLSSSGQQTVNFPINFTTVYLSWATANDPNQNAVSVQQSVSQLKLKVGNAVIVNWFVFGIL